MRKSIGLFVFVLTSACATSSSKRATPTPANDTDVPAAFRACTSDLDCVAVDRVGCCHNGWKEAVAASEKARYASSFACPERHPMCAMYIAHDLRIPECDKQTHLCAMVRR